jgi:hypothetical protein
MKGEGGVDFRGVQDGSERMGRSGLLRGFRDMVESLLIFRQLPLFPSTSTGQDR